MRVIITAAQYKTIAKQLVWYHHVGEITDRNLRLELVGRLVAPDLDVNYWHTSPELIRLDEEASKIATKTKEINVSRSIGMGDSRKLNITDNTDPNRYAATTEFKSNQASNAHLQPRVNNSWQPSHVFGRF